MGIPNNTRQASANAAGLGKKPSTESTTAEAKPIRSSWSGRTSKESIAPRPQRDRRAQVEAGV
jgi:hypothetical protein